MLETLRSRHPGPAGLSMQAANGPADSFSLHALLDIGRRRWLFVVLCVAAALALAAAYVAITPKKYAATATVLIDSRLAQLSQTEASATVVDQAAVESQIELLRSEKMLDAVIDNLHLLSDPEFGSSKPAASPEVARRQAIAVLTGNLWVARVGRSYLVNVIYSALDPAKAALIANGVVSAYISDQVDAKVEAAKDQNAWLDAQVNERRSHAWQAYRAVQDFKNAHDVDRFQDIGVQQQLDSLAAEASRARTAAVAARSMLDAVNTLAASPDRAAGRVPDRGAIAGLGDQQAIDLVDHFTGATAAAALWQRVDQIAVQRRAAFRAASAKQEKIEGSLADLRLRDTRNRMAQDRLRELETEAATSRSLYESYLNQLTHAAQQQPVPASDTRMISAASAPLFATSPRKTLTAALAGIAGVVLGLGLMFVVESLDDVLRTRNRLEAVTELPCIGFVPRMRRSRMRGKHLPLAMRLCDTFPRFNAMGARGRAGDLLRSLQIAAVGEARRTGATVLGITSAIAGEGKTAIALNLALSARASGRRVLLVDCNLRNPSLTRAACEDVAALPQGLDMKNSVAVNDGFDILPASSERTMEGSEMPDPDLLGALIGEARAVYDLIILDLPAILPLTELRASTPALDALVLITRWGSTTALQIDRAMIRLADTDRFIGVVLNDVRVRAMRRFEGSASQAYADSPA